MIASASHPRLAATVLLMGVASVFFASPSVAQGQSNPLRHADAQIVVPASRITRAKSPGGGPTAARSVSGPSSRRSLVRTVAEGRVIADVPTPPLDGSLVGSGIRQVGHTQPTIDQVGYLDHCDGNCGPVCDCAPACGIEAGCGAEVGCGVGAALEHLGAYDPTCGIEIGCGIETLGCDGCDSGCDACCDVQSVPVFLPFLRVNWARFEFFAGVQGFTGPTNFADTGDLVREGAGSFGFFEGFNEGRSLRNWLNWDLAAQLGVRFTQSNLSEAPFSNESRQQVFVTAGWFRRVDYGLQYGTVFDYLNDDWYFQADLVQSRSELSWKTNGCHVYGFQYTTSLGDDTTTTRVVADDGSAFGTTEQIEAQDQYRLFYRRLLNNSGKWEAFAGFTEDDDGILGALMTLPLRRRLALSTGATYLIPDEGGSLSGFENEAWNVSLGLVYRPGGPKGCGRYCRPMFDVADNGTFIVGRE